jgi:hypothetical protein
MNYFRKWFSKIAKSAQFLVQIGKKLKKNLKKFKLFPFFFQIFHFEESSH